MQSQAATPLAVLRHATTAWNLEHRLQGRSDPPLTDAAEIEVQRWRLPAAMRSWRRCSSPLLRARRTTALLSPPMPFAVVPALIEMDFGAWEGRTLADLREKDGPDLQSNERRGVDLIPPGGESPRMVIERLVPWLDDIAARGLPTIAITHKGVLRALLSLACGWTMVDKPPVRLRSDALHLFEVRPGGVLGLVRPNIAIGRTAMPRVSSA